MRRVLTYTFFTLALVGVGVAVYALIQPNPSGDYLSGMAQLVISMMGAAGAVFCAIVAAILRFSRLRTAWIILGAALVLAALWGVLELI